MTIKRVWIEDGCAAGGLCSTLCPEVFVLKDVATVNQGVRFADYDGMIKEAVENCPEQVIKYSE